jgi:hypothetical protein
MQKNPRKASILIWAIFLSLIISVSFIEISTKINKNLKNNKNIINNIQLDLETENLINNITITKNFTDQKLSN